MAKKTTKPAARKSQTSRKPTTKKAVAKKATAQRAKPIAQAKAKPKTAAKKAPAKKPATSARKPQVSRSPKPSAGRQKPATKTKAITLQLPATRRPSPSPLIPLSDIHALTEHLDLIKVVLEDYAAHLRSLDRKRHNGVGIKRQGLIERSYQLALENQEFLPHWLPMAKFREDNDHFISLRTFFDLTNQIKELAWNLVTLAADMVYTDALEFYAQVQDAANRRVDAAETLYHELRPFFTNMGTRQSEGEGEAPTQKKAKRDANAVMKGKKEGVVIFKNTNPKLTAGKREIIDETFKGSASFKETEEGEITE